MPKGLPYIAACCVMLLAVLLCAATLVMSRHGFSGYDVGPMIDAGWRVYSGQVPGRDFIVTFPASLYLTVALSYKLFGVTWRAIALGECALYLIILVLGLCTFRLLRAAWGLRMAAWILAVYTVGQTLLLLSINYPWHASMAESFGAYAFVATLPLLGARRLSRWQEGEAFAHLTLACCFLLLSKPNTAFPAIAVCFLALALQRVPWSRLLLVLGSVAIVDSVVLSFVHVTLPSMLGAYLGLTGRLIPKAFFNGILYTLFARYGLANLLVYAILAPAATAFCVLLWKERSTFTRRPALVLAAGAVLVSVLGMGTNFDYKLTDTPMALLGLSLLAWGEEGTSFSALRFRVACASVALLLLAGYFGRTRLRMQTVGLWADDKCPSQVVFNDPFLGRMTGCPAVAETTSAVDQALRAYPHRNVFFGPAMEFLYAGRRLPSPLHLPNWWDPGSSYPLAKTQAVAQAWQDDHFDVLIFAEAEDMGHLPASVARTIATDYVRDPAWNAIHVYVRRPDAPAPVPEMKE